MEVSQFIEEIKKMTVVELNELVKAIEKEFGVSAAAQVAVAGAAAPVAVVEEKTEFDVILKSFGAKKIDVIKVVRELTGLGLVEAKNLVEAAPSTIKEAQPKEEADKMLAKLVAAGAEAELK
ncbi:MAG: 50S ribosomal protein L7/L12 [Clostridia bacterium]